MMMFESSSTGRSQRNRRKRYGRRMLLEKLESRALLNADPVVVPVVSLDEVADGTPEGLAVDQRTGDIYYGLNPSGAIYRIPQGSNDPELFGQIDGFEGSIMLGLTVDTFGNVVNRGRSQFVCPLVELHFGRVVDQLK